MCAPGSLCLPLKKPTPSRHESQSVTADGIMLRHIIFPAKVWHYYDSVYHSCFTAHELCRKAIPHELIVYFLKLLPVTACLTWRRHEPYIRFPAKVWHDYASVYHSCFTSHELCRKAVPLSWKCISSSCYRSLACRHEPYIRFPAKVWHAYASVYHSCFMSHELCRKAVPLSWQCLRSGMTRTKSHKCVALQLKQVESLAKNI